MKRSGRIMVTEFVNPTLGMEVSYETLQSRKTFHLPRPTKEIEDPPLAIESFAQDPEHYSELMKRVEKFLSKSSSEGSKE